MREICLFGPANARTSNILIQRDRSIRCDYKDYFTREFPCAKSANPFNFRLL